MSEVSHHQSPVCPPFYRHCLKCLSFLIMTPPLIRKISTKLLSFAHLSLSYKKLLNTGCSIILIYPLFLSLSFLLCLCNFCHLYIDWFCYKVLKKSKYQPSSAGDTCSPPASLHRLQNTKGHKWTQK